ncbi:MAG: peptidoglycan DD-metalloendopeptidase family protein [Rhodospirillales bacterium]|nr:peptidoglycan DD-metalloendopeptidase family protein [Rhodospirillales bacterium]
METLQENLRVEEQEKKRLAEELKKSKSGLESLKNELVKIGRDVQKSEEELSALEDKIAGLETEQETLSASLKKDYGSISGMVLALSRMRRVPPESLIARPGAPLETAQSALLLQSALPAVKNRSDRVAADIKRLDTLQKILEADRQRAQSARSALDEKQQKMTASLKQRETLYKNTQSDFAQSEKRIASLSLKARSLQDLLDRLEEDKKQQQAQTHKKTAAKTASLPATGPSRLPVAGTIKVGYGQRDEIGAKSEGLRIETRPHALVTAPMGGKVIFAGAFKNYGQMVIIEHRKSYHSLIGGLDRIDVLAGQSVDSGEPLGQMATTTSIGGRPALYYELRFQGRPVDPAVTLAQLN